MNALALLEFAHPLALALLVVPLGIAWLAARFARAHREATGTVPIWREVVRESGSASERRRTLPWKWLLLVAAMCAAVVALSGPRTETNASSGAWRVIVDLSPSMYLPVGASDGPTRLERALSAAKDELARVHASAIEWIATSGEFALSRRGADAPEEWLRAPRAPWDEPRWELYDSAGTMWLTDRSRPSRFAGVAASGGDAVPGVVATFDDGAWWWDGATTAWRPSAVAPVVRVSIDPALAGSPLARAFDAWASARGYARASQPLDAALVLAVVSAGESFAAEVGRDGWSAKVETRAVPVDASAPSESWLAARTASGGTVDVVRWSRGEVRVGWTSMEAPRGDPAAFAVSWAELLDSAVIPRAGIPLAERSAAGESVLRRGASPQAAPSGESHVRALLAALATLLALGALLVRD